MRTTGIKHKGKIDWGQQKPLFTPILINYPAMTISAADRKKLLARKEIKTRGWDQDKLVDFLSRAKNIMDNLHAALGYYPELKFYIGLPNNECSDKILLLEPLERRFTFLLGNERDSDFVLRNAMRSICEHLGQYFLVHSRETHSLLRDPVIFINGIDNNPFLEGLRLLVHGDMSDALMPLVTSGTMKLSQDKIEMEISGGEAERFLRAISANAPEYVRAKVTKILHPTEVYDTGPLERITRNNLIDFPANLKNNRGNFAVEILILAHAATLAEIRNHSGLTALIESGIKSDLVPAEAERQFKEFLIAEATTPIDEQQYRDITDATAEQLLPKAMKMFNAIKNCYLEFFKGIRIKHAT